MEKQYKCPICKDKIEYDISYPNHICSSCATNPVDENGRDLEFCSTSGSGGFIAQYMDTGEVRDSHICFISGKKCWPDEAKFGGIIIQELPK